MDQSETGLHIVLNGTWENSLNTDNKLIILTIRLQAHFFHEQF